MVNKRGDALEIIFSSRKLEVFLSPQNIMKNLNKELAHAYYKRYNELRAAKTFAIYLQTGLGHPEALVSSNDYSIRLTKNYRLIVRPESETLSIVDLQDCTTVEVKGVVDYHGAKSTWKTP